MKRILALILSISLVLSIFCISPVSAADESYSDKAIEVVADLGLMNARLTLDPNAEMTRGDLIETVLNLCDVESFDGTSVFTDLDDTHVHYNAIMTAYNMGLVSGFGDGTVRPDEPAQVSQAMKLIYYALGYKEFLAVTNSPAIAVERAEVGTLSDTNSTAVLTAKKLAALMVEAGESHPMEVQAIYKEGDVSYEYLNAGETVLERYYDISRVEGVVTSAGGMNLVKGVTYNSDWIVIDGTVLRKDMVSADAFFGQRVVAYYRQYKDTKDKRLVTLYSYNNNVTEINPEIYDGYDDGKVYYEVGDMQYEDIDVSFSSADMFVNNVKVSNANESYFDIDSGKITFIDNNKDRKIDVIIVVEYETYVVDSVNSSLNIIFGKYNDEALVLNDYESTSIVAENGDVIFLEELSSGDVLSVVKAADKSSISIVYALTELRGTIEETREVNGRLYVTIDGKEYRVTSDCKTYQGTLLTAGRKGIFPLNASGEISTYKSIGEVARFGYVIETKRTPGLVSTVMSKILDENGEVNVYNYDKNVKIDGTVYNCAEAVSRLNGVLVSYTTDADGLIKTVDTPFTKVTTEKDGKTVVSYEGLGAEESHLNSLQLYYNDYDIEEESKYKSSSGILGGKVALDTTAPIFVIPRGDAVTDSDYKAFPTNQYLQGDKDYDLEAYKMDDRSLIASVSLIYTTVTGSNESVNSDTKPVFVEKATRILDANGDPVTKIVGYYQTYKMEFYLTDDLANEINHTIRGGDIIKISYNSENYIKGVEILYDYATRSLIGSNPSESSTTALFRIMEAKVYRKVDSMIISTTQELVPGTDYEGKELTYEEVRNVSKYNMFKYDERTETISKSGPADLVAFEDTGSICSEIVIYDRYGDPNYIYIFND